MDKSKVEDRTYSHYSDPNRARFSGLNMIFRIKNRNEDLIEISCRILMNPVNPIELGSVRTRHKEFSISAQALFTLFYKCFMF